MLAGNYFDFKYQGHHELKGKSISIPFFEPLNPELKFAQASQQANLGESFYLSLHTNPMCLEKSTKPVTKSQTLGYDQILNEMKEDIRKYYVEHDF